MLLKRKHIITFVVVKITTTKNYMAKLISDNPELLLYLDNKLHITILGGIKLTGLDRLKVTVKLIATGKPANAFPIQARECRVKAKSAGFSCRGLMISVPCFACSAATPPIFYK